METSNIINRVITFTAVKYEAAVLCDKDGWGHISRDATILV